MAGKPYETKWRKVQIGQQIAVDRRGYGYAWRLADVESATGHYRWRVVIGVDREGPVTDRGGSGINGPNVVVRDLPRRDQTAVAVLVQHIRNAQLARDQQSVSELRRDLDRLIAAIG